MTRLLTTCCFLLITWSVSAQDSIKCMSYNIRMATAEDQENQWENRKEALVDFLKDENADFIGIQEALWVQVEYLEENMTHYDVVGVGRDDGKMAGEAMIILYKKDRFQLEDSNTSWLSDTPDIPSMGWDAACNRTLTTAVFNQENGRDIVIFNTHFDHRGIQAREESMKFISDKISEIPSDVPFVLMGDFNFEPTDSLYQNFSTFGADAHFYTPLRRTIYDGTFNGFRTQEEYNRRIDYIIYDPKNLQLHEYHVPSPLTEDFRFCSDHFPVITKFTNQ